MKRRWPRPQAKCTATTAVVYLVRGRDAAYRESAQRFLTSYRACDAGIPHDFVLLCKGFDGDADRAAIEQDFARTTNIVLDVADDSFDLGAYRAAAHLLPHERVCFLNGYSEILSGDWLLKLSLNLDAPEIGATGSTGSFETLDIFKDQAYPNVHLRSNGFLLERDLFLFAVGDRPIMEKTDAFAIESGPDSMTHRIRDRGLEVLVVGADGRGYPPPLWPRSRTFRLGRQDNLLVGDNQTRAVDGYRWLDRAFIAHDTWKEHLAAVPQNSLRAEFLHDKN